MRANGTASNKGKTDWTKPVEYTMSSNLGPKVFLRLRLLWLGRRVLAQQAQGPRFSTQQRTYTHKDLFFFLIIFLMPSIV